MKRYPAYKDSGVEWIGKIPEGWEIRRLRYISKSVKTGTTPPSENLEYYDEGNIDWYTPGDFGESLELLSSSKKITVLAIKNRVARIFEKGTILLVGIGATLGKIALMHKQASLNQQINAIVLDERFIPKFYAYYLNSIKDIIISLSNAATLGIINQERTKQIICLVPSKNEQSTIANYLDHKTAMIDELIKKNKRLIELLKEKRQAIISHAVTKGLVPNANMKDSGIEWIREMPEGWEVKRLKFMSLLRPSNVDKKNEVGETEVRLCNYIDVYNNESIDDSIDFMVASATSDEIKKFRILRGDVLITKDSEEWNDIAVPSFVNGTLNTVLCGYHLALVRPKTEMIDGKYLFWSFQSYNINIQFRVSANGITRYGLSKNSISSAFFLVPPISEQQTIANFLDQKTAKIDGTIQKILSQIEKLKEYRQALISNVVTGKVSVAGQL